jgi:lysophospholipid acyltransferase (LPLAT)-like uncharacterized protein
MRPIITPCRLASPIHGAYRILRRVVRWSVDDPHGILPRAARGEALIFACRHGQLMPLVWAMEGHGLTVVVSRSPDGELLARVLARRGYQLIRGSTSEEGLLAGRGALRVLRQGGRIGVAVDGPRGPRGKVQDGILRIARAARTPIVPLWASVEASWVAPGSWDRFEVPLPWGAVRIHVGEPVAVAPGSEGLGVAGETIAAALGGWRSPEATTPNPSDSLRPSPSPS